MNLWVWTCVTSTFLYSLMFDWRLLALQGAILLSYGLMSFKYSSAFKTSTRRKIAISSWGAPADPSVYGNVEINCEILDDFLTKYNAKNPDKKLTYTHIFLKAIGLTLNSKGVKGINGKIAFGNFVPFEKIDVSTLIDVDGKNLYGVTVEDCGTQSILELRNQVNSKIKKIKLKKDDDFKEQMRISDMLPTAILSLMMHLSSFLSYSFGINVPAFRVKKHAFGSIILTNVSKMNIKNTFAPLVNFSNSMMVAVICTPCLRPVVNENREIVVRKMVNFNVTFDHRFADGSQASQMISTIQEILKNPNSLL